MTSKHITS